jgi:hypothetical protein
LLLVFLLWTMYCTQFIEDKPTTNST